jgi:hypothetical protein
MGVARNQNYWLPYAIGIGILLLLSSLPVEGGTGTEQLNIGKDWLSRQSCARWEFNPTIPMTAYYLDFCGYSGMSFNKQDWEMNAKIFSVSSNSIETKIWEVTGDHNEIMLDTEEWTDVMHGNLTLVPATMPYRFEVCCQNEMMTCTFCNQPGQSNMKYYCSDVYYSADCSSCAEGRISYPDCLLACTEEDCNGHASGVSGAQATGCTCTCTPGFFGDTCDACAPSFGPTYPSCQPACTDSAACNNTGTASGFGSNCTCTCNEGFAGATCNTCALGYGPGFPYCLAACTPADCNNKGRASGFGASCSCACNVGYVGERCKACASTYGPRYPICGTACIASACNNKGTASGYGSNCTCNCDPKYGGDSC